MIDTHPKALYFCVGYRRLWVWIHYRKRRTHSILLQHKYDYVDDFSEEFACVQLNGKWDWIAPVGAGGISVYL
ncbi:MAG: WG repeat-containing protein [Tannerella sp.]|nr:WG repeat-containing protein [Tannerella sp.]